MKWLRHRVHWAGGVHKWEYVPLCVNKVDKSTKERIQKIVEKIIDNESWSDKYRKVEYEIINTTQVSNSKIERVLESRAWEIEGARERIERLEKEIVSIQEVIGKGRKTDPDEIESAKRRKIFEKRVLKNEKAAFKNKRKSF